MLARVLVDLRVVISEATLFVGQCAIDQLFELLDAKGFKLKNLRPRHESAVYIKEGVVRSRADEPEVSSLNVRQKNVLLRFVEMMDLINKQNRLLARSAEAIRCRSDNATHFCDVAFHATNSNEFCMSHLRNNPSKRCLSAARRPGENHRWQTIGFNCPTQKFSRPEDMFLADEFFEGARAHPRSERRSAVDLRGGVGLFPGKQIVHKQK